MNTYTDLIHVIHEGIAITSVEFEFLFANQAAEKIFGVEKGELIGMNVLDFVYDKNIANLKTAAKGRLEGKSASYDIVIQKKNGEERILNVTTSPYIKDGERTQLIEVFRDITIQKKLEEKINYMTFHDSLTDLYNRAYLEQEMEKLDTQRQMPLSILMIDLNNLKLVNDLYGHRFGDMMLVKAAKILKSCCRDEDTVARFGGDEFVILLPQTINDRAETVKERILEECDSVLVQDIPISLAIGVATKYSEKELFSDILTESEELMYKHKLLENETTKSALLKVLLKKLSSVSYDTEESIQRIENLANLVGERMGLAPQEVNKLTNLISLRNIGNATLPEKIFKKQGKLSELEWEKIRKHPEKGYRVAISMEKFMNIAEDIFAHHEWFDGEGYPRKLKGEKIPLLARIVSIVDAYDVMVTGRPYKKPVKRQDAVEEIKKHSGSQFDPDLVDLFISVENEYYSNMEV